MKYSEYRELIEGACCDDEAYNYLNDAEDDSDISSNQYEKLENLFYRLWGNDNDDEDFQLANLSHGGDLLDDD